MTAIPAAPPARHRLRWLGGALLLLAALWLLEPAADGVRLLGWTLPELCPHAAARGASPGCGTTRAALSLARGDWRAAWGLQPAIFLFLGAALAPLLPLRPARGRRLATALALAGAAVALVHTFSS